MHVIALHFIFLLLGEADMKGDLLLLKSVKISI